MSKKAVKKSKVKSQKPKVTKSKPGGATKKAKSAIKKAKPATSKTKVKKAVSKKTVIKKAAPKKAAPKKAVTKKTVTKKAVAKKTLPERPVSKEQPQLLKAIIEGMEEKKAKNITVLNLSKIYGRSFDYFVIADADSGTHVESIAASVEETAKKMANERPYHTEGWQNAEWILLDYINIIVHVFQRPIREFYNLEGLWADAEVQKIN